MLTQVDKQMFPCHTPLCGTGWNYCAVSLGSDNAPDSPAGLIDKTPPTPTLRQLLLPTFRLSPLLAILHLRQKQHHQAARL